MGEATGLDIGNTVGQRRQGWTDDQVGQTIRDQGRKANGRRQGSIRCLENGRVQWYPGGVFVLDGFLRLAFGTLGKGHKGSTVGEAEVWPDPSAHTAPVQCDKKPTPPV